MDGLDNLLELSGTQMHREDGYWWKIEVWCVPSTPERPHGIRYNLTLHNRYNKRVFGMDNSHSVKRPRKGVNSGKVRAYDHVHKTISDKGTPYEFKDGYQLLSDFFEGVDRTIEKIERGR